MISIYATELTTFDEACVFDSNDVGDVDLYESVADIANEAGDIIVRIAVIDMPSMVNKLLSL